MTQEILMRMKLNKNIIYLKKIMKIVTLKNIKI